MKYLLLFAKLPLIPLFYGFVWIAIGLQWLIEWLNDKIEKQNNRPAEPMD